MKTSTVCEYIKYVISSKTWGSFLDTTVNYTLMYATSINFALANCDLCM